MRLLLFLASCTFLVAFTGGCEYGGEQYEDGEEWTVRNLFIMKCFVTPNYGWETKMVACLTPAEKIRIPLRGVARDTSGEWRCHEKEDGSIAVIPATSYRPEGTTTTRRRRPENRPVGKIRAKQQQTGGGGYQDEQRGYQQGGQQGDGGYQSGDRGYQQEERRQQPSYQEERRRPQQSSQSENRPYYRRQQQQQQQQSRDQSDYSEEPGSPFYSFKSRNGAASYFAPLFTLLPIALFALLF
ncbi:major allergen [Aphelenchoides avenae]|nr:major allergen [Aphelenchus avenae]